MALWAPLWRWYTQCCGWSVEEGRAGGAPVWWLARGVGKRWKHVFGLDRPEYCGR